ncbi:MAG TPA: hypothetical protein VED46_16305 [Alphaproteobacteria bacterium]|nr:hypothetical protein [Alphaproteobacteria bacterium]
MVVEKTQRAAPQIRSRYNFGINGNPIFPEMFRRAATAFGGPFLAARLLLEELITGGAIVLRDSVFLTMRLSGFSAYRMQAFAELYFGLSAHHGDGVEAAFAGDGRALSVSVHEEGSWHYSGVLEDRAWGTARNLPVPPGLNDTEFKLLADGVVLPLSIQ